MKENAACSLFPERGPLPLERRSFGESKCLHLRAVVAEAKRRQRRQFSLPTRAENEHNKPIDKSKFEFSFKSAATRESQGQNIQEIRGNQSK